MASPIYGKNLGSSSFLFRHLKNESDNNIVIVWILGEEDTCRKYLA